MNQISRSVSTVLLAACVGGTAVAASAQGAPERAAAPIVVNEDSPPGSSRTIAVGAGIGVLVGLAVAVVLLASISD